MNIFNIGVISSQRRYSVDSIAYYNFKIKNDDNAIKEQVSEQTSVLTIRDSDANIDQSNSSIITYEKGEAALNIGGGVVIEGEATNYALQVEDPSLLTGAAPATAYDSEGYSKFYSILGESSKYVQLGNLDVAGDYTMFITVKAGTASNFSIGFYESGWSSGTTVIDIISGNAVVTLASGTSLWSVTNLDSGDSVIRFKATGVTASSSVYLYPEGTGFGTGAYIQLKKYIQIIGGLHDNQSSPIFSTTAASTRAASDTTISTYTELGAFNETPSNSTVTPSFDITSNGTVLTSTGLKYAGVMAANMIGAIIEWDGNQAYISAITDTNNAVLTPINYSGTLADAIGQVLTSIDWSRSAYTEAEVITLRTIAGDANVWDTAEQWSVNDFEYDIRFEYRGTTGTDAKVLRNYVDANNYLVVYFNDTTPKVIELETKISGSYSPFRNVTFTADIAYGDWLNVNVTRNSTLGTTITVENETAGETKTGTAGTDTADLFALPSNIGLAPTDGGDFVNIKASDFTMTPAPLVLPLAIPSMQAFYDVSNINSLFQDTAKTVPVTASGDPVAVIVDLTGNGHDLVAPASNNRATYTVSGSSKYLNFEGVDDLYRIVNSKAAFKYLHDGTGGESIGLWQFGNIPNPNDNYSILSNSGGATANVGINLRYDDRTSYPRNDMLAGSVTRGVAGQSTFTMSANSALLGDTQSVFGFSYGTSETPNFSAYESGVSVKSENNVYTPSSANSTYDLSIGATNPSANTLEGRLYSLSFYNEVLSTANRASVNLFMESLKG